MEAIKPTIEQRMEQEGALMVKRVTGLTITNDAEYERGGDILKDIKARIKAVKDYWKAPKAAAQAAHKRLRQVEFRTQAPDHPILWAADESYYLKFLVFQVVDEK